jgi:hypothetical protein
MVFHYFFFTFNNERLNQWYLPFIIGVVIEARYILQRTAEGTIVSSTINDPLDKVTGRQ